MVRKRRTLTTVALVTSLVPLVACSLTDTSGLGGGDGVDVEGGTTGRGEAGADGGGDGSLVADAARDAAPCTRLSVGKRCMSDSDCCSKNCFDFVCAGNELGSQCSSSDNCQSKNCFDFVCAGNELGSRCSSSDNCQSKNCFNFVCEGNGRSSPCADNRNCSSGSCFDFKCQ